VSFPQPEPPTQPTDPSPARDAYLNGPTNITIPTNRLGMDPRTIHPTAANPNPTPVATMAGIPSQVPPVYPPSPAWPPATDVWTIQELLGQTVVPQIGDDLILTDVLSFDVKVLQQGYGPTTGTSYPFFVDLPHASLGSNLMFQNYPAPTNPPGVKGVSVFDTWTKYGQYSGWSTPGSFTSMPLKIRILALQITLRVWDERSQQARQMTIIQEM
jgi:hypothetical protein